jgi:hypothetical protein
MSAQPEQYETLSVEPHGKDFAVVRTSADGSRSGLVLPETSLIFLARMLPETVRKIVGRRDTPQVRQNGLQAIHAVPVTHVKVNQDMARGKILLSLIEELGNEVGFALDPELARQLGEDLVRRAAGMRA